jgi:hypothetical protein
MSNSEVALTGRNREHGTFIATAPSKNWMSNRSEFPSIGRLSNISSLTCKNTAAEELYACNHDLINQKPENICKQTTSTFAS